MRKIGAIYPRDQAALPSRCFAKRKQTQRSRLRHGYRVLTDTGYLPKDGVEIAVPAGRCGWLTCPKRRDRHESESLSGGYYV